THIVPFSQNIDEKTYAFIKDLLLETTNDVLGYVLENLQVKNIHNYFDIIFNLKHRYLFDPMVVTHLSSDELAEYLTDFLKASIVDNIERSVDVFDDRQPKPWKTLKKISDLENLEKNAKDPVLLERPFFSDIHFNVNRQGQIKVIKSAFGQLKSVQQFFSKSKSPSGELFRSKNKIFLKWKDIHRFKLGSTQSKSFLGISYKGEFIAASKLITHDVALKMIGIDDIDSFKFRINKKQIDVSPGEISQIEINLDTQQMLLTRDVTDEEYHVGRFKRLSLKKGDLTAQIHKVVPFNRGASNFELIQTTFGTRYTECEKARNILNARGEYGLLGTRNIVAGDLISHLVLASMNLLGFLPFDIHCLGFKPEDVRNPVDIQAEAYNWIRSIQKSLAEIIDISKTPNFTEHNFTRLTKAVKILVKLENPAEITPQHLIDIIKELEGLIRYMDDFFKLNIYQKLEDDLECETVSDSDETFPKQTTVSEDSEDLRLDDQTKTFIAENYAFFEKRDLIGSTLIGIEKVLFYNKHIKPYAEDRTYNPDLIVYSNGSAQLKNFQLASYPAVSLLKALDPITLGFKDEEEELRFIKFMREFTQKCHQKALELNKTFHHQFKHTLSELTFIADEKIAQLKKELAFLETPSNKEAAYKLLLERITALYHQHLKEKQENIDTLGREYMEVKAKYDQYKLDLEELLGQAYSDEELSTVLSKMPDQLEMMKRDILTQHKTRLTETSPVFNAYLKLYNSAINYFKKNLSYANLFLRTLWVHRNKTAFQEVKEQTADFFSLEKAAIQDKIAGFENFRYDEIKEKQAQQEIHRLTQKIKATLIELSKIPVKGLFQDKKRDKADLSDYLTYYQQETDTLCTLVRQLHPTYQQLSHLQNLLFKQQEELVACKLEKAKNDLRIQISRMIADNPDCRNEIDALERKSEKIPKEIKEELRDLRAKLLESVNQFTTITTDANLEGISDYNSLFDQGNKRHRINEVSKELVNFTQGLEAIEQEKKGELEDLSYLVSQEENLEKVAMSKALPSTRVLLKSKYIPMFEEEKKMLSRANQFLSEIISREKEINQALVSTFFQKRYGVYQFTKGSYCLDITSGAKDHTERNIYNAFILIAERFTKALAGIPVSKTPVEIRKLEVKGIEGLRNLVSQIWHGHLQDRFLFLPSSLSLDEALDLCEYKDLICKNNPKRQKSQNSLILIYVHKIVFEAIERSPEVKTRYNQAILSNIFINVDGVKIFNNRDSIFEACIRETFGKCHDKHAGQAMQNFLFSR
ncbi:hypothetical protein KKI24_02075, partial [bacterium]|nr:hypothetical protein [bacterium]